jgi:uncharacterized protein
MNDTTSTSTDEVGVTPKARAIATIVNGGATPVAQGDTPEAPIRPFPGILASILWIVAFLVLQVTGIVAVTIYAAIAKSAGSKDAAAMTPTEVMQMIGGVPMIWSLVGSSLLTLFLLWLYLRGKDRFAAIGLNQWSQLTLKRTLALAALLCSGAMLFNYLYETYAIPNVKMQDELQALFASIPATFGNRLVLFMTVAVLAPAVEELLFRGLLQKSLSHKMPIVVAIGISSAIFAAMHMDFYAFPALFAMGSAFGFIYYRTGSLRVNILLHMINNGAALVLSWVMPS